MYTNTEIIVVAALLAILYFLFLAIASYVAPVRAALQTTPHSFGLSHLIFTAVGGLAIYSWDLAKGAIQDESVPGASLNVFIEDVSFGFPKIGDEYQQRLMTFPEMKQISRSFDTSETITFNNDEADRVNGISATSSLLPNVQTDRPYSLPEVAELLVTPMYYHYRYMLWSKIIVDKWKIADNANDGNRKLELVEYLNSNLGSVNELSGILRAIVGMANQGNLSLPEIKDDCIPASLNIIRFQKLGDTYYAVFTRYKALLVTSDDGPERAQIAEKFVHLLDRACFRAMNEIFQRAAGILRSEGEKMKRYVEEVKRILYSRQSDFVTITATLSNVGKYDSFIRKDAKVLVGTKGDNKTAISFIAQFAENESSKQDEAGEQDESNKQRPGAYVGVASRKTRITKWSAKLSKSEKDRIYGLFVGELTYLRMGMIANAGDAEIQILSPLTPFSERAKGIAIQRIRDLKVSL